ncbi:hypothetical protein IQ264_30250 [Phormidium sp. LEGE 05292]|uniref:hypothetical protein n=1 Tax=[Phormidium] sp. LEGE 05292 TaxID=767427 RepID=UPI0018820415|nr:hypothetical protein [Phormidium sp. LEGE 05292]MBE9229689.1 hypothetical protein [Phormidium sp. LEGE 05292]
MILRLRQAQRQRRSLPIDIASEPIADDTQLIGTESQSSTHSLADTNKLSR